MAETTSLQDDVAKYDQSNDHTNAIRNTLVNKLMSVVDITEFTPKELNSEGLEARMSLINTVSGLLNDIDKSTAQRVSIKQKNRDSDSEAAYQTQTVAVLREFARRKLGNGSPIPDAMSEDEMAKAEEIMLATYTASGEKILPTELRDSPSDLT